MMFMSEEEKRCQVFDKVLQQLNHIYLAKNFIFSY